MTRPRPARALARFTALRRDLHAHPELGFAERRTAAIVARTLREFGYAVTEGVGGTGVVGTLSKGEGRAIGLRADMDALPIEEQNSFAHRSTRPGVFHGCGHDGHTAMLLAGAEAIAAQAFQGTVHLIFQPAEEGLGGAEAMIADGVFERFPCALIFGMHNFPGLPLGRFAIRRGPFLASNDRFELRLVGRGGHVGMPHLTADPVAVAAQIVTGWYGLTARRADPAQPTTLSVTTIAGGETDNAIASSARVAGSIRTTDPGTQREIEGWMRALAEGVASAHGVHAEFTRETVSPALVNDPEATAIAVAAAERVAGRDKVETESDRLMGAEDFAAMLRVRPGAYMLIGAGDGAHRCMVHDPTYDFNDALIPIGAAYWAALTRKALGAGR